MDQLPALQCVCAEIPEPAQTCLPSMRVKRLGSHGKEQATLLLNTSLKLQGLNKEQSTQNGIQLSEDAKYGIFLYNLPVSN